MEPRWGWRLAVMAALVVTIAAACGSSGGDPNTATGAGETTVIDPADAEYWVAGHLPDAFEPVVVSQDAGTRTIAYAEAGAPGDVGDAPLQVTVRAEDAYSTGARSDAEVVSVGGHDAFVVPLTDEGRAFGVAVTWQPAPGRWVSVWAAEGVTREEALAVADDVRPVDAQEWDRLRRGLSIGTHAGVVDPDATEVVVVTDTIDGDQYALTALVPGGYPLGPEDRRADCYRLTFRSESSGDLCDAHPWWRRIGGQIFVFGPADADTAQGAIGPYQGGGGDTTVVPTAAVDGGPPTRFYVSPLAEGRCFVDVARTDGVPDVNLGPIGPLPNDPDHATCLQQLPSG